MKYAIPKANTFATTVITVMKNEFVYNQMQRSTNTMPPQTSRPSQIRFSSNSAFLMPKSIATIVTDSLDGIFFSRW